MGKNFVFALISAFMALPVMASIPSTAYVQQQVANQIADSVSTKVDTSATATQTMAGTYTVSGTMNFTGATTVPTAPLPSAE
ncbi:MAG: hypothetical protein IJE79_02335 [Alphaproteobacteria bacterium]|nr:hypothetical protein [Alphaproteobacteria bacterium]